MQSGDPFDMLGGGGLMGNFKPSSLLDFAMQRPQQAQPVRSPAPQPQPQGPQQRPLQGAAGLVAQLFGIGNDPRLTPDQQRQLRSQALIAAGSQLADDPGNFAGAVGRAVMTGRKTHEDRMKELDQRLHDRRVQQALAQGKQSDPDHLRGLALAAAAIGDNDEAKLLAGLARDIEQDRARLTGASEKAQVVSPGQRLIRRNPETGEVEELYSVPERPASQQLTRVVDPETGIESFVWADPRTQRMTPAGAAPPPSQGQRIDRFNLDLALDSVGKIEEIFAARDYQPFSLGEEIAVGSPILRTFAGKEAQTYDQLSNQFAEAYLRPATGAAINASEEARAKRMFLPQPGDKPEVVRHKIERAKAFTRMLNARAGAYAGDPLTRALDDFESGFDVPAPPGADLEGAAADFGLEEDQ